MEFERRLKPQVNVDLVPMIDIVFQLVVFFMLSSTLVSRDAITVDLPSATTADEIVTESVSLIVRSSDELVLNGVRYTFDELDAALASDVDRLIPGTISIEAAADQEYGTLIAVLDLLRRNGVEAAGLITREVGGP